MKINKTEQTAIETLRRVLDAIEAGQAVHVTAGERNAVQRVLGLDLFSATARKKEVAEFIRGKSDFRIEFGKSYYPESWTRDVLHHGYFPFQVKTRKP